MIEAPDSKLTVDITRWPLVVLRTIGTPSDSELRAHLQEIESLVLAREEPFVQIIDQRKAGALNAGQRALIAEHQSAMDGLYARFCRGEAYVADQAMKGIMIAVFWQAKPPYPYRFFERMPEAERWAREKYGDLPRFR